MVKLSFSNLIGYFFAKENDSEFLQDEKPLKYVTHAGGIMEVRKTNLGTFMTKAGDIKNLQTLEEGVILDLPKIPLSIFEEMAAWFRWVYKKDRTESTAMVFYNEKDGYQVWIPKQNNSGASSNYKRDEDPQYSQMCKDNDLVMVVHSHPWAGTSAPGPSGIDDKDEKESLLYMILNNVEGMPNAYVSSCPGGKRIRLNFFDIFENPIEEIDVPSSLMQAILSKLTEREIFQDYLDIDSVEIPEEWKKQHSKESVYYQRKNSVWNGGKDWKTDYKKPSYNGATGYQYGKDSVSAFKPGVYSDLEKKEMEHQIGNYYSAYNRGIEDFENWKDVPEDGYNSSYGEVEVEGAPAVFDVCDDLLNLSDDDIEYLLETLLDEDKSAVLQSFYKRNQEFLGLGGGMKSSKSKTSRKNTSSKKKVEKLPAKTEKMPEKIALVKEPVKV